MALRSKGHWGYTADFLESCRAELTYDVTDCGSGQMWVAETGAVDVGFGLIQGEPPSGELAALFVDPSAIGTGCGKLLLRHVCARPPRADSPVCTSTPTPKPHPSTSTSALFGSEARQANRSRVACSRTSSFNWFLRDRLLRQLNDPLRPTSGRGCHPDR